MDSTIIAILGTLGAIASIIGLILYFKGNNSKVNISGKTGKKSIIAGDNVNIKKKKVKKNEVNVTGNNNFVNVDGVIQIVSEQRINTPVPRNKLNRFVSLVTIKTMEYEKKTGTPPDIEGDLRFFLDETVKFSSYQQEKPIEVAMLYRLYSSIYLLMEVSSNQNWSKAFENIENILKYSVQLFEENLNNPMYNDEPYIKKILSKFPQFKNSVFQLEKIFSNLPSNRITPEVFRKVTLHNLVLAMPSKEMSVIEERAKYISDIILGTDNNSGYGSNTKHWRFLIGMRNSNHYQLGAAIKLLEKVLTIRNAGEIHSNKHPANPYYFTNKENGLCRIEYNYLDNGKQIEFYWDVSKERRILNQ